MSEKTTSFNKIGQNPTQVYSQKLIFRVTSQNLLKKKEESWNQITALEIRICITLCKKRLRADPDQGGGSTDTIRFEIGLLWAPERHPQKFIVTFQCHNRYPRDVFLTDRYLPIALYQNDKICVRRIVLLMNPKFSVSVAQRLPHANDYHISVNGQGKTFSPNLLKRYSMKDTVSEETLKFCGSTASLDIVKDDNEISGCDYYGSEILPELRG
ncbi:hypothetical protein PoB_001335100 [Plakobranchus ocellatus]|uniref:Uncharacterized protein n=1 Tax=Plakobranchus ocellatus TaxID=259542 RepID=A0AAV3YWT6_9GAST|nr:hypothetical protein PoB_001335100 [Plakobranchus ocellatus]